jgi:hypothetical protein
MLDMTTHATPIAAARLPLTRSVDQSAARRNHVGRLSGATWLVAAGCLAAALVPAGGCDRAEVRTYEVPKTPATPTAATDKADPHAGHDHGPNDPHALPPAGGAPVAGASTTSDPAAGPAGGGPVAGSPTLPPAGPMVGPVSGPPAMGAPQMMAAAGASPDAELAKPSDKDEPITVGAIKAVVPAGWRQDTKQRAMREATFVAGDPAKGVSVIISRFGGAAGGLRENLNRWRAQVKLPAVAGEINEAEFPKVKIGGADAMVLDVTGPADKPPVLRLVQAVAPRPGSVFYIKIIGDAATVGEQKAAFDKFLASIQIAE